MTDVYYFGVWDRPGHYLHDVRGNHVYGVAEPAIVFYVDRHLDPRHIDGTLAPVLYRGEVLFRAFWKDRIGTGEEMPQGQFLRHDLSNGYTTIQWWDRVQGDSLAGCNSTVLAKGKFTSDEMLAFFAEHFPSRKARLDAAGIKLVDITKEEDMRAAQIEAFKSLRSAEQKLVDFDKAFKRQAEVLELAQRDIQFFRDSYSRGEKAIGELREKYKKLRAEVGEARARELLGEE